MDCHCGDTFCSSIHSLLVQSIFYFSPPLFEAPLLCRFFVRALFLRNKNFGPARALVKNSEVNILVNKKGVWT